VDACVVITQQEHNEVGMCDVVMRQSFASSLEEPCRSDDEFSNDDLDEDDDDTDIGFGTYVCILNLFIAQKATCTSMVFNAQCMHTYMYFLDWESMMEVQTESQDYWPFPSKEFALLYFLINGPHPLVCFFS